MRSAASPCPEPLHPKAHPDRIRLQGTADITSGICAPGAGGIAGNSTPQVAGKMLADGRRSFFGEICGTLCFSFRLREVCGCLQLRICLGEFCGGLHLRFCFWKICGELCLSISFEEFCGCLQLRIWLGKDCGGLHLSIRFGEFCGSLCLSIRLGEICGSLHLSFYFGEICGNLLLHFSRMLCQRHGGQWRSLLSSCDSSFACFG